MSKVTNQGINYKGSLLERADKEGWKVTVLKPQGKQDEQFIRDKFRDEVPHFFESPDKTLVAKGGMYDNEIGDGNKDIENLRDYKAEKSFKDVENWIDVRLAARKLTKIESHIMQLAMDGLSYREMQKTLKISSKTIRKALDKIKSIIQ